MIFFALFSAGVAVATDTLESPLSVKIKMEKDVYQQGEEVKGRIEVFNEAPSALIATFKVTLTQNGLVRYTATTAITGITAGTNKYTFASFGIPSLAHDSDPTGDWQLEIGQLNVDSSHAGQTSFRITGE